MSVYPIGYYAWKREPKLGRQMEDERRIASADVLPAVGGIRLVIGLSGRLIFVVNAFVLGRQTLNPNKVPKISTEVHFQLAQR